MRDRLQSKTKMYAHRGVHRRVCEENTIPAFRRAIRSMDGFECDVRLSRDRVPVVVHDATLSLVPTDLIFACKTWSRTSYRLSSVFRL